MASQRLVGNRPFYQNAAFATLSAAIAWRLPGAWGAYFTWSFACYVTLVGFYAWKAAGYGDPARVLKPGQGWGWLVTLPMTVFNRLALNVFWATLGEDAITDVGHGLYLSGRLLPKHRRLFEAKGIRAVVDLCSEFEEVGFIRRNAKVEELACPNLDLTPPHAEELRSVRRWMLDRIARGDKVLVHCAYGHGRSYAVALLVLKALDPAATLAELEPRVKSVRPRCHLSRAQRRAVEAVFDDRVPV